MRILPPCVNTSEPGCSIIDDHTLRLGLTSIQSLDSNHCAAIISERMASPFRDLGDFRRRCQIDRDELQMLSAVGALNCFGDDRRGTLWQSARPVDALPLVWDNGTSEHPLRPMSAGERLNADYAGLGLTVGAHPMKHLRPHLQNILSAGDLRQSADGRPATIAGAVICRQRPGTAKGVVFISLEDETGVANAIIRSQLFEHNRLLISSEPFLKISGFVQSRQGVVHLLARKIEALDYSDLPESASHDFH